MPYDPKALAKLGFVSLTGDTKPTLDYTPEQQTSALGAFGRSALGAALPTAGGIAGAEAAAPVGAALGAPLGPIGAAVGGLAFGLGGAILGGTAAGKIQQSVLDANPGLAQATGQDAETRQLDARGHPIASLVGSIVPQAIALNPTNLLTKGLTASERVAAAGGAAIGGVIQGGQDAIDQYRDTGHVDPLKLGISTAAGVVFSGSTRFGLGDIVGKTRSAPIPDGEPTSLLHDSGPEPEAGPQLLLPAPEPKPQLALPAPAGGPADFYATPSGITANDGAGPKLSQLVPTAAERASGPVPQPADQPRILGDVPPEQAVTPASPSGSLASAPQAPTDILAHIPDPAAELAAAGGNPKAVGFTRPDVLGRLTEATANEHGFKPAPDMWTKSVADNLSTHLANDDPMAARKYIDQQTNDLVKKASETDPAKRPAQPVVDARTSVLTAAHDVVESYIRKDINAQAAEGLAKQAAAPGIDFSPEAVRAELAKPRAKPDTAEGAISDIRARNDEMAVQDRRHGMLDAILHDPETRNPIGRFISALKGAAMDRTISEAESDRIAQFEHERLGVKPEAPDQSGNFGIKEKPLLTRPDEAQIARQEASIAKADAPPPEPALAPGAENRELFDANGQPSSEVSHAAARAQADAALAAVKGTRNREVVQAAHDLVAKGDAAPALVEHVAKMAERGEHANAKQLVAAQRAVAEDARAAKLSEGDAAIRAAAKAHADALAEKTPGSGSTVREHFMNGVDQALGVKDHAAPEGPTKAKRFEQGQQFVKDQRVAAEVAPKAGVDGAAERAQALKASGDPKDHLLAELDKSLADGKISAAQHKLLKQQSERGDMAAPSVEQMRKRLAVAEKGNAGENVQHQAISRRDFLRTGAASPIAAVAAAHGAKATTVDPKAFSRAIRAGKLNDALSIISTSSTNPLYRQLAQKLISGGMGKTILRVIGKDAGTLDQLAVEGTLGLTRADGLGGPSEILLADRADGHSGTNEETLLHEAIHAYVQSRYRSLATYLESNRKLVDSTVRAGDEAVNTLREMWHSLSGALDARTDDVWAQEMARSPDEFLSWAMTHPDAQAFLKTIDMEGKPLANEGKPTMWSRFVDWVKNLLGIKITDDSAFGQIMDAGNSLLDRGRLDAPDNHFAQAIRKFQDKEDSSPMADPVVSMARAAGFKDVPKTAADAYENMGEKARKATLNLLAVRQFPYWFKGISEHLEAFSDAVARSGAARQDRLAGKAVGVDAAKALQKSKDPKVKADFDNVGKLLQEGSHLQIDPRYASHTESSRFKALSNDEKAQYVADHKELRERYQALTPEGRRTYDAIRDSYIQDRKDLHEIEKAQINESALDPGNKKAALAALESKYSEVEGYFPQSRFGDKVAIATSPEYTAAEKDFHAAADAHDEAVSAGKAEAETTPLREAMGSARERMQNAYNAGPDGAGYRRDHFEKASDLTAHVAEMKAKGYDVRTTTATDEARANPGNPVEVNAIHSNIDKLIAAEQARVSKLSGAEKESALRSIENMVGIKTMMAEVRASVSPERSALRAGLRRKNVAGYSEDWLRVHASNARRNAGFLSALEFGTKARHALADIHTAAEKTGDYKYMQAYDQLKKHFDLLGQYAKTPVQDFLANAAYAYNLGGSPAFSIMHLMQTPMVTLPMMAGRHGMLKAGGALTDAAREAAAGWKAVVGHDTASALGRDLGEQEAIKYAERMGTIATTDASSLMSAANPETSLGKAGRLAMAAASFLPHYTEKFNRVITLKAAYRLGLKDANIQAALTEPAWQRALADGWGASREEFAAAKYAREVTLDSHVEYGRENAAYYMQPGAIKGVPTKLLFQFQKYQQGMIELEARNLKDLFDKNLSMPERMLALRTVAGVVGSHALMTGAMGMPGFGAAMFLMNAYHKLLSENKHEPWEAEVAFRQTMGEHFGLDVANVIARGGLYLPGINKVLPADVTNRLGMGELLAPAATVGTIDRPDFLQYLGTVMGGPAGSMVANYAHAYSLADKGKAERGLELILPAALRNMVKTARMNDEGIETEMGAQVVRREDLTGADLVMQAMGFTPQKVATDYANRVAVQNAKQDFKDRKTALTRQFEEAVSNGGDTSAAMAAVQEFNSKRAADGMPFEMIQQSDLSSAVQKHMLDRALLQNGLSLPARERALAQEGFEP